MVIIIIIYEAVQDVRLASCKHQEVGADDSGFSVRVLTDLRIADASNQANRLGTSIAKAVPGRSADILRDAFQWGWIKTRAPVKSRLCGRERPWLTPLLFCARSLDRK
jgi:hypothetical protein